MAADEARAPGTAVCREFEAVEEAELVFGARLQARRESRVEDHLVAAGEFDGGRESWAPEPPAVKIGPRCWCRAQEMRGRCVGL